MSLKITDHFEFNESLGIYDFTLEKPSINRLRGVTDYRLISTSITPLPVISFREYGDVNLWWVIAVYNNIVDVTDLSEFDSIKLPSLTEVQRALKL